MGQTKGPDKNTALSASPLGPHRSGFQKVNQVLADGMMRSLPEGPGRKLVVFTDSRQDAAKLSAGIELDHYRDLLRQALLLAFDRLGGDAAAFLKFVDLGLEALSPAENEARRRYAKQSPDFADAIREVKNGDPTVEDRDLDRQARAAVGGPFHLETVSTDVWNTLLRYGCNPAGPMPTRQQRWIQLNDSEGRGRKRKDGTRREPHFWTELIDWGKSSDAQPRVKGSDELGLRFRDFVEKLQQWCCDECVWTLFAHKRRSVESLRLGWVTCSTGVRFPKRPASLKVEDFARSST